MVRGRIRLALIRGFSALAMHSIEAFLALLCLLVGVPVLASVSNLAPDSVVAILPLWAVYVWAGGLAGGGLLTLTGLFIRIAHLERAGVALLAGVTGVYGAAIFAGYGMSAFIPLATYAAFCVAMVGRYWAIGTEIRAGEALRKGE